MDTPHNSQERACDTALESSQEPSPGKCAERGELNFLYAEPTPVIPHCASLLTLSQILAKRHCYNKEFRTCHIDGPFSYILAAGRHITKNVTAFFQY